MYVCLCLCLSLYGREVTVGYARLRGSMGATFCHLAALRSAIEFLFWDHWETAVLSQILAGRSQAVTGANFCHLAAPRPLLNFSSGIIGKRPFWAKSWSGGGHGSGHGRSWEVTVGYGRLREVTEEENGGKWRNGRKKVGKKQKKTKENRETQEENGGGVECRVWSVECGERRVQCKV